MQQQDVLSRLKQVTTDRVPRPGRSADSAGSRLVLGEYCHNCGEDTLSAVVRRRQLVPGESEADGNRVSLCERCHGDAPTAETTTTDAPAPEGASGTSTSRRRCAHAATAVDGDRVRDRDDHRCRGCGVRERIVVGDDLHVHAVVPISGGGYRHARNYVSLCPTCHRKVHA